MSKFKWPKAVSISGALLLVATIIGAANKVALDFEPTITKFLVGDGLSSNYSPEDLAQGGELTTNICENGIVLLKNTDNALPTDNWNINIFGFGGSDNGWYYQGNGSGAGSASGRIPLTKAFQDWGWTINENLANAYNTCGLSNRVSVTEDAATNYQIRETNVDFVTSRLSSAKAFSDQALIVISRYGGEGNDLPKFQYKNISNTVSIDTSRHYNELTVEEEQMVEAVCNEFSKVYVLFNCCNVMEMGFLEKYPSIKAAMFMPMGGNAGSYAVPKIMGGLVSPSGKLSDTIAYDFKTAPSYANMSYESFDERLTSKRFLDRQGEYIQYTCYQEDIYIGYYWYETADKEGYWENVDNEYGKGYEGVVQYPFGYGLSYSSFDWEISSLKVLNDGKLTDLQKDDTIEVVVDITNTGNYPGKDVAELYVEKPYYEGGIEKSSTQLVGFFKTKELEKGETERGVIRVRLQDIADYDCYDKNNDAHMGYELDAGNYKFSLKTDAHNVKLDASNKELGFNATIANTMHFDTDADTGYEIRNRFTTYTNQTSGASSVNDDKHPVGGVNGSIDGSDFNGTGIGATYLTRANFEGTFPTKFLPAVAMGDWYEKTYRVLTPWDDYTGDVPYQNQDGTIMITDVIGKDYDDPLWDELLNRLSYAELIELVTSAAKGSFGTSKIDKIGKPETIDKDGPCGFNSGVSGASMVATNYPSDTMIACTWDYKMSYQFGKSLGEEGVKKLGGIEGNYGPGLNIHRSPFGGRNFEYYSEDALLSGILCSWQISGAKEEGMYCYVKHIALNDSDTGRNGRYNFATEQSFRQIYAKPFEIISKGATRYDLEGKETRAYKANAAMGSVDRLGTTRVTGSYNFLTEVLRNEWGFRGAVITDYYQSGNVNDVDEGIRAGNDLMLNGAHNCVLDDTSTNTYKYYVRQAAKNILYMYADTKYCQATATGMDIGSTVIDKVQLNVWWTKVLALVDVLIAVDILAGLYFTWSPMVFEKINRKKEEQ